MDSFERQLSDIIDDIIDEQEDTVLKELNSEAIVAMIMLGAGANFASVAPLASLLASSQKIVDAMSDVYRKAIYDNISEGYGSAVDEQVMAAALSEHLSAVNSFNSTTQAEVVAAMQTAAALTDDDSGDVDVALKVALAYSLIKSVFNKLRKSRKKLIVESATLGPYNQGLYDSVQSLQARGVNVTKQWVSLRDERVRQTHRHLHGEKVAASSAFYVDGIPIRFPKDPLAPPSMTINCRCFLKFGK